MKRYIPSSCNWMESGVMLERKDGKYVSYEDVVRIVEMLFYQLGDNQPITAEKFIEEWE